MKAWGVAEVRKAAERLTSNVPKAVVYSFAGIGMWLTLRKALQIICDYWRYRIRGTPDYPAIYGKASYVLVTGASDGIGEQLAYRFAGMGFGVVLVGRNEDKLNKVKERCVVEMKAKVVIVVEDLASTDVEVFQRIADQVSNLDISILINNAGVAYLGPFQSHPLLDVSSLISLNVLSHTLLTRLLLPQLLARPKKSLIINTASISGVVPVGYMAVYSATKAYLRFFSLALREETMGKVDVYSANPGRIDTKILGALRAQPGVVSLATAVDGLVKDAPRYAEGFCSFFHCRRFFLVAHKPIYEQARAFSAYMKSQHELLLKREKEYECN